MYRERRRHEPELPATADDIQLNPLCQKTEGGHPFLVIDGTSVCGSRILAFASREALLRLSSAKMLFVDGTFFVVPQIFDQLLTIHVTSDDKHSPAVYFLLPGRSRETHVRAFQNLRNVFTAAGLVFPNPDIFLTDKAGTDHRHADCIPNRNPPWVSFPFHKESVGCSAKNRPPNRVRAG
ncbi:unnamed protein product [Ixodes hexagonus]